MVVTRWTAWWAVTNSNPWTGSRWSPAQTRPRLLRGSPALHEAAGPLAGAAAPRHAPPCEAVRPLAGVERRLLHPVPDRLGRRLKLARELLRGRRTNSIICRRN